jgi:hypothetical protein
MSSNAIGATTTSPAGTSSASTAHLNKYGTWILAIYHNTQRVWLSECRAALLWCAVIDTLPAINKLMATPMRDTTPSK